MAAVTLFSNVALGGIPPSLLPFFGPPFSMIACRTTAKTGGEKKPGNHPDNCPLFLHLFPGSRVAFVVFVRQLFPPSRSFFALKREEGETIFGHLTHTRRIPFGCRHRRRRRKALSPLFCPTWHSSVSLCVLYPSFLPSILTHFSLYTATPGLKMFHPLHVCVCASLLCAHCTGCVKKSPAYATFTCESKYHIIIGGISSLP